MKAVHAWSAHELGGKRAPPETLFDLASPDRPSRSDTGSFEHALKDLIKTSRNETGSMEEPQDMRRSVDSQDGTPVPIQAPPNPDWSEPARTIVQVRNEAAPSAFADASGMGSRPAIFSVGNMGAFVAIQLKNETLGFAGETGLPVFGPVTSPEGEEPTVLPMSAHTQEPGTPMNAALSRHVAGIGMPDLVEVLPEGVSLTQRAVDAVPQGVSLTQRAADAVPEGVSLTQQAANVLPVALFSDFTAPISAEDEAVLGGSPWNRPYAGNLLDSSTTVPPSTPFVDGLMPDVLNQTVQPSATHAVGVEFENLFDQFVQGVRLAQRAGETEILVNLKPDFLGKLSVRVLADEYGMRVEIKAESEIVRQIMQDNLADLQQRLAEKGFASSQLSVLADTGWTHRRGREETPSGALTPALETAAETATEVAVEPMSLTQGGMINYLV
jgi:hypothetical protein